MTSGLDVPLRVRGKVAHYDCATVAAVDGHLAALRARYVEQEDTDPVLAAQLVRNYEHDFNALLERRLILTRAAG